jgi:hydroxymethylbilane synthase
LSIVPLRGNLDTRLRKLDEGQYAAIVLAAAGLKRLGLAQRIAQIFEPEQMLPAAGQGALGIETMAHRTDLKEALAPLAHASTWLAVSAEREVSRTMGGSCSMPLAAFAVLDGNDLQLRAAWGDPEATANLVQTQSTAMVSSHEAARSLGQQIAKQLVAGGARMLS